MNVPRPKSPWASKRETRTAPWYRPSTRAAEVETWNKVWIDFPRYCDRAMDTRWSQLSLSDSIRSCRALWMELGRLQVIDFTLYSVRSCMQVVMTDVHHDCFANCCAHIRKFIQVEECEHFRDSRVPCL